MSDLFRPEDYASLLATTLAELTDRLRHCSIHPGADTPGPACTARLEVTTALLTASDLIADPGSLAALGDSLARLLEELRSSPGRDLTYLEPALEFLAEVLEAALARLDAGEPTAAITGDPLWLAVLSRLNTAGTPLEIMDELDASARRWEGLWCDRDLPSGQERELRRRWQTFREYGDAMFGQSSTGALAASARSRYALPLLLLVESVLRRDQLLHRLGTWGHEMRLAASVEDALGFLRPPKRVRAILCDNLEPSNHLARLAREKTAWESRGEQLPALILVTVGSGNTAADLKRARGLGADGVWTEPFRNDPVSGIMDEKN